MAAEQKDVADTAYDRRAEIDQIAEAAIAALRAPSILNSQPWRWRMYGRHGELWIDRRRQLSGLDPDGRLLMISCGTALDHAITALLAAGYGGEVNRLPDEERPDLVARLWRGDAVPADQVNYRAIYTRRTDRRPFAATRPGPDDLDALRTAAERHGAHLHLLPADQVPAFAVAVARAGRAEHVEDAFQADIAAWTTRAPCTRDGVSMRTTTERGRRAVPPRDFGLGRAPSLDAGTGTDRGTVFAIVFTDGDESRDWLAAGEALSDVWLTLTARGLAASPISEVVEVVQIRQTLRRLLGGVGYPAIALRVGVPADPAVPPPASIRRSGTEAIRLPGEA